MKHPLIVLSVALLAATAVFAEDPVVDPPAGGEVVDPVESPFTGEGKWFIEGDLLTIASGDLTVVGTITDTVQYIEIAEGATLRIDSERPFGKSPVLYLHGTFDLNGHSLTILRIANFLKNADQTDAIQPLSARVVNTSEEAVTLRLNSGAETAYYGKFEELPGKISVETGNAMCFLLGPDGADAVSSLNIYGSANVLSYSQIQSVRFVLHAPTDDPSIPIRMGEIELTSQGRPLEVGNVVVSSAAPDMGGYRLNDRAASTSWQAGEPGDQVVTLFLLSQDKADGYRLTPYDGNGLQCRPSGVDVYVHRTDKHPWVLVDSRTDIPWSQRPSSATENIPFTAPERLGSVFGEDTALSLSGTSATALRVSTLAALKVGDVSGTGGIRIEHGSVFEPGDLTDYKGTFSAYVCDTYNRQGEIRLSTRHGKAEQPVAFSAPCNVAVVNGGTEPVSVLLDDSRIEHLFGRLADGENGKLGLVKRGRGERVIETEDSSYTGETRIEEGTLTVARKRDLNQTVTTRYIRFAPTKRVGTGPDDNGYTWAANELQLLDANGKVIVWPSGTKVTKPAGTNPEHGTSTLQRFVDNNPNTRTLVPAFTDGSADSPALTITLPTEVTFSSYCWYSTRDHSADKNRTPIEWKLEISDNGTDWFLCDFGQQAWGSEDEAAAWKSGGAGIKRGAFPLRGAAVATAPGLCTLPERHLVAGTERSTHGTIKARYFTLRVHDIQDPFYNDYAWGWQLAEIGLMKDGARVDWPADVKVTCYGASVNGNNNSKLANLANNIIWEPKCGNDNSTREHAFIQEYPSMVRIDAGQEMEFDTYSLVGVGNFWYRMPKAWKLEISNDNNSWESIDIQGSYIVGQAKRESGNGYPEMGPFPVAKKFPLLDRGAGDSLGDASPVVIAEGATLKLATDYERFGSLSGKGTLNLDQGAVGEINACADGSFGGRVIGDGTLAVCGDGVQTFDGADLSGVKTLELNGGAIAGTATFGGKDVKLAFNGGALDATLTGLGTLTVEGEVKYAIPADASTNSWYGVTLVSGATIPEAAQTAFRDGTIEALPKGWGWEVTVDPTTVKLNAFRRGLMLLLR